MLPGPPAVLADIGGGPGRYALAYAGRGYRVVHRDVVGLEGPAFALDDLAERLAEPLDRDVVLDCARAVERVPELLGLSPHLLVVARAP